MKLDEYFLSYPDIIIGFRLEKNIKVVDILIDNNWVILDKLVLDGITFKLERNLENNKVYYKVFSDTDDFDTLYGCIVSIIKYNLELIKKNELFTQSVEKLKNMFETLDYESLTNLKMDVDQINTIMGGKND